MAQAMTAQHSGSATLAFLAGISAGALAALLFTPRTGQELRRTLKDKALTTKGKVQEHLSEQKDKVQDTVDQVTALADKTLEEGSDLAEEVKGRARRAPSANP